MPFMTWVKTPKGYEPVEMTDEEMFAENAKRKAEREKMERISEQLQDFDRTQKSCLTCSRKDKTCRPIGYSDKTSCMDYEPKERDMEFNKSRVYTCLNADELHPGDKVICADCMADLKEFVQKATETEELVCILSENNNDRFNIGDGVSYNLAYLIELKENCTNCGRHEECGYVQNVSIHSCINKCDEWKPKVTEKKRINLAMQHHECSECKHYDWNNSIRCLQKHRTGEADYCSEFERVGEIKYRPFKDVAELIKVWGNKIGGYNLADEVTMPLIWVSEKNTYGKYLITGFHKMKGCLDKEYRDCVLVDEEYVDMKTLFSRYTFLDFTLCGAEE